MATSLTFVIPSYLQGASIIPTLESLNNAVSNWSSSGYTLVLSDSSTTEDVVSQAQTWAQNVNCTLIVDRSETRRPVMDALNAAFAKPEVGSADIVIVTNDDVLLDPESVTIIVEELQQKPNVVIAVGCTRVDPHFAKGARRASAWQMKMVGEIAKRLPSNAVRAEGSLWATTGAFAHSFRFPAERESIADDVELADYVIRNGLRALNLHQAVVYKIPASGVSEFSRQTRRYQNAAKNSKSSKISRWMLIKVASQLWLRDPKGAFSYFGYRSALLLNSRYRKNSTEPNWERAQSTWR